jgi:uncharacterized cupin superfamily protein
MTIAHWDDVEKVRRDFGNIHALWSYLGEAAGSRAVGVRRIELAPGEIPTPAHAHSDEEEIFFVLAGSGLSWQNGVTYEVGAGDCLVHRARTEAHTIRAGGEGLDLLAFGPRPRPGITVLPNQQSAWLLPTWVEAGTGEHPFAREPELDWPAPSPRPPSIVNLADVEGSYGGIVKHLAKEGGALQTGLNWTSLPPNEEGAPPHCHSADEEIFVVLDGEGTLELWAPPSPAAPVQTEPAETIPVRRGHVVSRPAATRVSHCFRSGPAGLTYLAYGTREPNDICYYPRSNKVAFRGIGLIGRFEPLAYGDGEPS